MKTLTVLFAVFTAVLAFGAEPKHHPETILIIRHAEKPANEADIHLSPEGKQRADALPQLFKKSGPFPIPDFIFATKVSKHSNRPVETVTPLVKQLNLNISATFKDEEYPQLVGELFSKKYDGKTVLICWHHGMIPELAEKLGVTDAPKWKGPVFDQVWVVTFDEKGKAKLAIKPQALLPGDTKDNP